MIEVAEAQSIFPSSIKERIDLDKLVENINIMKDKYNIKISDIETKFRTLKDSINSLMLSQQKAIAAEDDFTKIAKEYKLGSVSEREYKTSEYKKEVAQKTAQIAYYDFAIIYYNYLAAVDGLASAGAG